MSFSKSFGRMAKWTAHASGRPATFACAAGVIIVWAVTGPIFRFSDTWQLVINTGTTVITFLMVFLIQNTQNRDATAMQIKLDELIRALQGAHNAVVSLEDEEDEQILITKAKYDRLAAAARDQGGDADTGSPELEAQVHGARAHADEAKDEAEGAHREARVAKGQADRAERAVKKHHR